jgi:carbon-monoxide dehydrogenase iron sulfur subunit
MRLSVDKKKCTACETCAIVCAVVHTGEFNSQKANIHVPFTHPLPSAPAICVQCPKPACVEVCLENALELKAESGIVALDSTKCNGCGLCVDACKFHAIFLDAEAHLVRKCDVCDGSPRCIEFCQKGALSIKDVKPAVATV